ncbi:hypothetical protein HY837_01405 [archaeon]|nr:hypothetical protein [archaeon]
MVEYITRNYAIPLDLFNKLADVADDLNLDEGEAVSLAIQYLDLAHKQRREGNDVVIVSDKEEVLRQINLESFLDKSSEEEEVVDRKYQLPVEFFNQISEVSSKYSITEEEALSLSFRYLHAINDQRKKGNYIAAINGEEFLGYLDSDYFEEKYD